MWTRSFPVRPTHGCSLGGTPIIPVAREATTVGMLCNPPVTQPRVVALASGSESLLLVSQQPSLERSLWWGTHVPALPQCRPVSCLLRLVFALLLVHSSNASSQLTCYVPGLVRHKPGGERDLGHAPAEFTVQVSLSSSVEDGNERIKNIPRPFECPASSRRRKPPTLPDAL